jgi:hypothetical protein
LTVADDPIARENSVVHDPFVNRWKFNVDPWRQIRKVRGPPV